VLYRKFGADERDRTADLILTKNVRYLLCHISKKKLERVPRIELGTELWQSSVLTTSTIPANFVWWMLQGLNLWPAACRAAALPTELNILGAFDWTRTSMLLYSHQHLKLACIPFHHKGLSYCSCTSFDH